MGKQRASKSKQIVGLDGLRTLAAVGVLLFHMFPRTVKGGYFGVILFFVISGFLTAYNEVRKGGTPIPVYYKKRFFRIYPSLIIMLFVSVEVIALIDKFKLLNVQEEVASVLFAYNNYWQISKSADYFANLSANSAFTHLWYTSILIQFELAWPLLYRLFKHFKQGHTMFGILTIVSMAVLPIALLSGSMSQSMLYYSTLTRIHALFIGAWLGWQRAQAETHHIRRMKPLPVLLISAGFLVGSIVIYAIAGGENLWVYHWGIVFYGVLCGLIVRMLSHADAKAGVILDHPICHFVSTYSYEIYLWQYPVLFIAGLLKMEKQYILQLLVILLLSVWNHEVLAFVQRLSARRKRK